MLQQVKSSHKCLKVLSHQKQNMEKREKKELRQPKPVPVFPVMI